MVHILNEDKEIGKRTSLLALLRNNLLKKLNYKLYVRPAHHCEERTQSTNRVQR